MNLGDLRPRRHEPPAGWTAEVFTAVTDAISTALVSTVRRRRAAEGEQDSDDDKTGGGRA